MVTVRNFGATVKVKPGTQKDDRTESVSYNDNNAIIFVGEKGKPENQGGLSDPQPR